MRIRKLIFLSMVLSSIQAFGLNEEVDFNDQMHPVLTSLMRDSLLSEIEGESGVAGNKTTVLNLSGNISSKKKLHSALVIQYPNFAANRFVTNADVDPVYTRVALIMGGGVLVTGFVSSWYLMGYAVNSCFSTRSSLSKYNHEDYESAF